MVAITVVSAFSEEPEDGPSDPACRGWDDDDYWCPGGEPQVFMAARQEQALGSFTISDPSTRARAAHDVWGIER